MKTQARIYVADQRGCSETDLVRSYHTFNSGHYADEGRQPFGALQFLNDDTLRPGGMLTRRAERPADVVLLPIVGGLECRGSGPGGTQLNSDFLEPGQVQVLSLRAGMTCTVNNPYEAETVNFLQIWLTPAAGDRIPATVRHRFDLTGTHGLVPLFGAGLTGHSADNRGFIGRYAGRQEDTFSAGNRQMGRQPGGIFVFSLEGAFDVQGRLLHRRDGLALQLSQNESVEFEALSNEALLLLLEVNPDY